MKAIFSAKLNNRRAYLIALVIIFGAAIISCSPYLIRYLYAETNNLTYLGNFFSVTDINSYFSKILQSQTNSGLSIYNRFTTEEHAPIFIFIFWALTGKISNLISVSSYYCYQVLRLICGMGSLFTFYWFTGYFIKELKTRLYALILIIFATGISGLFYLVYFKNNFDRNFLPPDFWGIDQQPIWRFFLHPHISLALALSLIVIVLLAFKRNFKPSTIILLTILNLAIGILAPHILVLVLVSLGLYFIYQKSTDLKYLLISGLPAGLYLIYLYLVVQHNIGWSIIYSQKYCDDIAIWKIVLGHGMLCILLTYYLARGQKNNPPSKKIYLIYILLIITVGLGFWAPLEFKNRFLEFINIPLAILGAVAFTEIVKYRKSQILERFLFFLFIALLIVNNLTVWQNMLTIKADESKYVFIPKSTIELMKSIDQSKQTDYNIFSSAIRGNYLPAISPHARSFHGHIIETVDDQNKAQLIVDFYNNDLSATEAKEIFTKHQIDYVFYGELEKKINPDFTIKDYPWLQKTRQVADELIYEVRR